MSCSIDPQGKRGRLRLWHFEVKALELPEFDFQFGRCWWESQGRDLFIILLGPYEFRSFQEGVNLPIRPGLSKNFGLKKAIVAIQ